MARSSRASTSARSSGCTRAEKGPPSSVAASCPKMRETARVGVTDDPRLVEDEDGVAESLDHLEEALFAPIEPLVLRVEQLGAQALDLFAGGDVEAHVELVADDVRGRSLIVPHREDGRGGPHGAVVFAPHRDLLGDAVSRLDGLVDHRRVALRGGLVGEEEAPLSEQLVARVAAQREEGVVGVDDGHLGTGHVGDGDAERRPIDDRGEQVGVRERVSSRGFTGAVDGVDQRADVVSARGAGVDDRVLVLAGLELSGDPRERAEGRGAGGGGRRRAARRGGRRSRRWPR
jgi:hypothetical protein